VASWNSAIAELHQRADSANNTAQQQQQQQEQQQQQAQQQQDVGNAQTALTSDVATLASDASTLDTGKSLAGGVQQMQNDLGAEQQAWQQEQSDSCPNTSRTASTPSP
jgi:hypothetical protein